MLGGICQLPILFFKWFPWSRYSNAHFIQRRNWGSERLNNSPKVKRIKELWFQNPFSAYCPTQLYSNKRKPSQYWLGDHWIWNILRMLVPMPWNCLGTSHIKSHNCIYTSSQEFLRSPPMWFCKNSLCKAKLGLSLPGLFLPGGSIYYIGSWKCSRFWYG